MWDLTTGGPKPGQEAKDLVANLKIDGAAEHVNQQVDLAQKIAQDVIESGAVGDPSSAHFTVHLAGHATEDQEIKPGESAPYLTVTVHQLEATAKPPAPPTPPAEQQPPAEGQPPAAEQGEPAAESSGEGPDTSPPAEEQPAGEEPQPGGSASEDAAAGAAAGSAGAGAGEAAPEGSEAEGATPPPDTAQQGEGPVTPPPAGGDQSAS